MFDPTTLKDPNVTGEPAKESGKSTDIKQASQPAVQNITLSRDQISAEDEAKLESGLAKIKREAKEKDTMEKASQLAMNYIDIAVTPINPDLLKIISREEAEQNLAMPFYRMGKKLRITVAHPTNPGTLELITKLKKQGYLVNLNLSSEEGIKDALRLYDTDQYIVKKEINTQMDEAKIQTYEKELADLQALGAKLSNVNSEEAVYLINVGALRSGSSDIHLEAEDQFVRARFRIDGILHEVFRIEKSA